MVSGQLSPVAPRTEERSAMGTAMSSVTSIEPRVR